MESARSDDFRKAEEAAYRLLSYKPRSRRELFLRLEVKGFTREVIEDVIGKLESQKYLNDVAYGQTLARSLIQRKLLGKEALIAELLKKGLDRDVIERIAEESYNETDEFKLASEALEKKWNSLKGKPEEIVKRKASDYLRRKGFPFSVIRRVLIEKFEV